MAVSTRVIKRRIRSVANTKKITKAMELVAASKMRKAVQMTLASREYSATALRIVGDVRKFVDPMTHPLLAGRPDAKRSILIVAASDRGLCGGFNAQIIKKTTEFLRRRTETVEIVTVGRRAELAVRRAGYRILASFEAISNAPSYERTTPVGRLAYDEFMNGSADRVFLAYTDFRNAVSQIPTVVQLLPVIPEAEIRQTSGVPAPSDLPGTRNPEPGTSDIEIDEPTVLFEPDARTILDTLLPRLLETEIYQSLLESAASEHSARMLAMRSATDNASGMLQDLTFTYNQARQATITREISEISAGKAAIE